METLRQKLPAPMEVLRRVGITRPAILAFALLLICPLFIRDEYVLNLMIVSLYFGAQAMVFDFTAGFIGIINFGFAAFVGVGAYVSALLSVKLGVSPWVGIWFGAAVSASIGWLTGLLTLRLRGIFATVMSWLVGLTLLALATGLVQITRGSLGLNAPLFLDAAERRPYFYILLPMALLIYLLLHGVVATRIGLAFRALGENLEVARASGIDPRKYRGINFTLSCFLAGLLGGFYAHFIGILTPEIMHTRHTVEVLALSYVGGRGSLWGGLLAAFLIIPAFEYLKPLFEIRLVLYGLLLIAVTIFYPNGLAGFLRQMARGER